MLLLVTPKIGTHISWWLRAVGCEENVTKEGLKQWYVKEKRGILQGSSPLIISGVGLKALAIISGITGINQDSKFLKWGSIILGLGGLSASIRGGAYTYNIISEAKNEIADKQEKTPTENKPTQITEKIIEHHHHYHDLPEPDREDSIRIETEAHKGLRIHPEETGGLSGEEVRALIEDQHISEGIAISDQKPIKESLKELQLLEEKFDIEKILSIVRKVLNKCSRQQYKNISKEAYEEIIEIGKTLDIRVLSKALEDKDPRLKRWAMLCLIAKGTEDAERVLIDAIKQQEYMAIMISFTTNKNVEQLITRITEIFKKAAA